MSSRLAGRGCRVICAIYAVSAVCAFAAAADAALVVVPAAQTSGEGNSNNGFPFNCAAHGHPSMRYQQVYLAAEVGTGAIDTIAFRADAGAGTTFGPASIPGVTIRLSSTTAAPDSLSATFAANVGADVITVYAGTLTLQSAASGGPPRGFDIVIPLQSSFSFNAGGGANLLLDITVPTCVTTTQFDAQSVTGDSVSRAVAGGSSSATATIVDSFGLVTQFAFSECVDGIIQSGEGCDDGNTTDGDGCSSSCQVEPCWACGGEPSVCEQKLAITTVDGSAGTVGAYSAVAVGSDGLPIVAYLDDSAGALKFVHCTSPSCATSDPPVTVASGGDVSDIDMAIGSDGLPVISYVRDATLNVHVAHCSNAACTASTNTIVDSGGVARFTAIAVGGDGLALVAYHDNSAQDLKVAHCNNLLCTSATLSTLDTAGNEGQHPEMTTGPDGFGVISYESGALLALKVARCLNASCSSATITTVDATSIAGDHSSIQLGTDGFPLISYRDGGNNDLRAAHCTDASCSTRTISTLDTSNVGSQTSIGIGGDGRGVIAYRDIGNADLKIARCANAACTSAALRTIDSAGDVGQFVSLAMVSGAQAVISYQDVSNGNLKVASCGAVMGDGDVAPGEECDDGNTASGDGCSGNGQIETCWTCSGEPSICAPASSGSSCPQDSLFCNGIETCNGSGSCVSLSDPCSGGSECNTTCNETTDTCFDANGTPCGDEPNICTVDTCDGAGNCVHTPGNAGALCRGELFQCDVTEHCDGVNAACPPDVIEGAGSACGDATDDACTDPDTCDMVGTCQPNHAAGGTSCPNDGNPCTSDQCDGGGSCVHPAGNAGVLCRADAGQCDVAEQCDGVNPSCPADGFQPNGTSCTDGSVCTQTDQCNGSGSCVGANPLNCDDGNACTANDCDPVDGCENPPALASNCKSAAKAILILKQNGGAGDKQLFKWVNGDILTLADLADPTTSTAYGICMYEGPTNEELEFISVPPGAPNWRASGTNGYKYKELNGTNSGITKMLFRGNDTAGKSKALVKGKGDNLPDPTLGDMQTPVTVQVINPDTGACVEAVFDSGDVKKNTSTLFKAKAQ